MLRTLPVLLLVANAGFAAAFAPASSILKAPRSFKAQGVNTVPTRQAPSVLKVRAAASMPMAPALVPEGVPLEQIPEWRKNLNLKAWADEVRAVEKEFRQNQGEEDVKHMKKMLTWSYALYAIGLATAGFAVLPWNPISALCLSTAICVRWTMIGHHVCHGGYSAQVGVDNRFHRSKFARGPIRRFIDWCDWMLPEAWDVEHNYMHHYELGEGSDPDLLERNSHSIRVSKQPKFLKYIQMFALMVMWKWFYYAPNTLKEMYGRQKILASNRGDNSVVQPFELSKAPGDFGDVSKAATIKYVFTEMFKLNFVPAKIVFSCLAPYFTAHFVITPLIFYALFGHAVAMTAFANLLLAEVLTNIHSFIIVVPNHAGEDIYRFKTPVKVKSDEFYLRAVIGSVNFRTGGNVNDFMHGWLNYQIEHHMFADMSMLSYQRMAPKIKEICDRHGVPYIQENVFTRLRRTLQIGVGSRSMKVWERGD